MERPEKKSFILSFSQNSILKNIFLVLLLFLAPLIVVKVSYETEQRAITITSGEKLLLTEENETLKQAFINFKQGNYQQAEKLFESYNKARITQPEPDIKIFQNNAEARVKAQKNNQKTWKIAIILKGNNKESNQAYLRGIADAQSQFNNHRRYQAKSLMEILLLNDSQFDTPSFNLGAKKLLARYPDLLAVVSSYTSTDTAEVLGAYEARKISLLSASATATTLKNDYFFRIPPTNKKSSEILSRYLMSKLGNSENIKKGLVIWNQNDRYSQSLKEDFESYLGKEIWQAEIETSDSDFDDELEDFFTEQNVRENNIKYVLLALTYRQDDIAIKISKLNAKLPKNLQLILLTGDTLYEQGNETLNNLVLVVPWFSDTPWGKKAEERWGGRVNWRTAMSYDALQAILEILRKLERKKIHPTKEIIWQELRSLKIDEQYTSGGKLYFDESQNSNRKPRLIETCLKDKIRDFCPIDQD